MWLHQHQKGSANAKALTLPRYMQHVTLLEVQQRIHETNQSCVPCISLLLALQPHRLVSSSLQVQHSW